MSKLQGPPTPPSCHQLSTASCSPPSPSRTACGWLSYIAALAAAVAPLCPTSSAEAAAVLYVTQAQLDGVAAYQIRDDGSITAQPFQRVSVGPNPRRLLVTSRALYVATRTQVHAFAIDSATGMLSRFTGAGGKVTEADSVPDAGFQYVAIDPAERYLYAAATRLDRILGYPIASDGSISEAGSCAQAQRGTQYQGLAATETTLYASAHQLSRVHIFPLRASDGAIQAFATKAACKGGPDGGKSCTDDSQCRDSIGTCNAKNFCESGPDEGKPCTLDSDCEDKIRTCKKEGVCRDGPDAGETCTEDADCADHPDCDGGMCTCNTDRILEVFTDCDRDTTTFPPSSSALLDLPKDLLLNHNSKTLYISDVLTNRIISCPIAEDGSLPDCPKHKFNPGISQTNSGAKHEQLALSEDQVLFASVFVSGKVRAFVLKAEGRLPKKPKGRHPSDVFATPVGVAAYNGTLYVAQGERNRVDAFKIGEDGFRSSRPFSRTAEIKGAFTNDVAVITLGCDSCAR